MNKKMMYLAAIAVLSLAVTAVWNLTARANDESAEYRVIQSEGNIEIREYPDLMLAATDSNVNAQGRDGSFMRLFRYISGNNESNQKIAMTTPVFMESEHTEEGNNGANASMGFVMPPEIVVNGVPEPKSAGVKIRKRPGGRFAAIRFSGRMNAKSAKKQEAILRQWLAGQGMEAEPSSETAGYDPPFTPGPMRRNEVLVRIKDNATGIMAAEEKAPAAAVEPAE